jgi:hypothetical protein
MKIVRVDEKKSISTVSGFIHVIDCYIYGISAFNRNQY